MTFIGDAHGAVSKYKDLVKRINGKSIQVGDFGYGFIDHLPVLSLDHRTMRGNHDDPKVARRHPNYLGDFGYIEESDIMYIGGGYSIDYMMRIPGISWWPDEELNLEQMAECQQLYIRMKPRVVVSHEAPFFVAKEILGFEPEGRCGSTINFLEYLWQHEHRPEHWIFGHYHLHWEKTFGPTHFHCLSELEVLRLRTRDEEICLS